MVYKFQGNRIDVRIITTAESAYAIHCGGCWNTFKIGDKRIEWRLYDEPANGPVFNIYSREQVHKHPASYWNKHCESCFSIIRNELIQELMHISSV